MLPNATSLRKSAPWPPNISHEHVFCTAPATENASMQILFQCPTPAGERHLSVQKWSEPLVFLTFWLRNVLCATTAYTFSTSQLPKVVWQWCVLYILTSKCASRHNGVHFFDISTSKSGPNLVCFVHFDFEMCFAPQRRALFRHYFQKWSEAEMFCTFWLGNALRATTACNFSSLIWPANSAPAALASLLFDPPEPQIIGKNTVFRDFPTFSRMCVFFLLALSLLLFSLLIFLFSLPQLRSAFHLSILSEVWLLNFLRLFLFLLLLPVVPHKAVAEVSE